MRESPITITTQVLVNKDDPAFKKPTKPVGPYYSKEEADAMTKETGSLFREDPRGRGWRKVVASPTPLVIINKKTIEKIARGGQIAIAVGGGGIPVFYVWRLKTGLARIHQLAGKELFSMMLFCIHRLKM